MEDSQTSQIGEQARCGTNSPHRILMVDDDSLLLQLSTEVLIHAGYGVDAAADGAAAWRVLTSDSYDLLITDNNMPKVTGVELLEKLHAARMSLPVIMASGAVPTEELNWHPWLKLDAVLLKPFSGDELLGTVEKVLGKIESAGALSELPIRRNRPPAAGLPGVTISIPRLESR
jgi:DNA-binding response OmpR family regulator